ncbi:MAG: hypothetical protein JO100_14405 [Pseudonocardia sp.]|nr:hypothetical protein [Pseudonocardia sp.]
MSLRKLVGFLLIIFVLFWIISSPYSASGSVNGLLADLRDAGHSMVLFFTHVF